MKASLDVVFATYSGLPNGDPDDLLTLSLLEAKGLNVGVCDWRTVSSRQLDSRLLVLRSTWDYHHYYQEFLDWVDVLATRTMIRNTQELIHWNSSKRYLLDIKSRGLTIVPTFYMGQKEAAAINELALDAALTQAAIDLSGEIVVKPSIGLSTFGVKRFSLDAGNREEICHHIATLAKSSDVLIQPYLSAVENNGEHCLMFFNGKFSHAVSKSCFQHLAAAGGAGERAITATADEIDYAHRVLAALKEIKGEEPLYARVDVVRNIEGQLMLMELELVEPSMFLRFDPQASSRFAEAICTALN